MPFTFKIPILLPQSLLLPHSKSLLIRSIIANYILHDKLCSLPNLIPNDVAVVADAIARIKQYRFSFQNPVSINVQDCGAAFRFLLAVLSITPGKWFLTGTKHLVNRPISSLISALLSIGASITPSDDGWIIIGKKLRTNLVKVDCSLSSQFASALFLIAPSIGNPSIVITPTVPYSNGYINMTRYVMDEVAASSHIIVEPDWSNAAFWYALILLMPSLSCSFPALSLNSSQPDAVAAKWFSQFNIHSVNEENRLMVYAEKPFFSRRMNFNFANNPDLALIFATMAVIYPFELSLSGIQNLNYKESKRLDLMLTVLRNFTLIDELSSDELFIRKRTSPLPKYLNFDAHNDHRFVMAWSLFATSSQIDIIGKDAVSKSYPQFFEQLKPFMINS